MVTLLQASGNFEVHGNFQISYESSLPELPDLYFRENFINGYNKILLAKNERWSFDTTEFDEARINLPSQ